MTTSHLLSMLSVLLLLGYAGEATASTTLRLREPSAVPGASAPLTLRALAPSPASSTWGPEWSTFSKVDGVRGGAAGARFLLEPSKDPRWERLILFASGAPDVLRLSPPDGRRRVAQWGDMTSYEGRLSPFVADPAFVAWLGRDDQKAAANLTTIGVSRLATYGPDAIDVVAGSDVGVDRGYAVPTLLHYSRPNGDVSVSLSPGGPCTGACLKVAGSF